MVETRTTLDNAAVLDVVAGSLLPRRRVVIAGGKIESVGPSAGRMRPTAWTANLAMLERTAPSYTAARAGEILSAMLMRGFTTVRDGGGADYGLVQAIAEGYFKGPRVLFCGRALSQTGGHGDMRRPGEEVVVGAAAGLGRCCDGAAEVRRACRDEIRKGANHIKLMLSGGVTSPTDRVGNAQFSEDEIRAAVDEAAMAGLYCMGHVYTARAAKRALRCGVRSLEHCNLIDESTAELFVKHKAFMVPTLITYVALTEDDRRAPAEQKAKLDEVKDAGQAALALAYRRGVKLAYGTDLLGAAHASQLRELALRARVQKPVDVIRSATSTAAELFCEEGQTGVVAAGARADLLVVDGDPLRDLACLQDPDRRLKAIIKGGVFYKNTIRRAGQR